MEVTRKTRFQARLENLVFIALFLSAVGLLAWLSLQYNYQADWTAAGRHTLSAGTLALLKQLKDPVNITAFAREDEPLRRRIAELIARYQRLKPDIQLTFVNPDTAPEQVRKLGITLDGELLIQHQGRTEKVQDLSEQDLTNALQRVARGGERWITVLQGHGERDPLGRSGFDLSAFARELRAKGFKVQGLNLVTQPSIPDNTTVLVIASPQVNLLPGEVKWVQDYLDRGGNLLWLTEPGPRHGLEPIAERFGIGFVPGTVVDPVAVQLFGAAFALVGQYGPSAITRDLNTLTLFPEAVAVELEAPEGWQGEAFLETGERSWAEGGELKGELAFDKGQDTAGPLTLGMSLEREAPGEETSGEKSGEGESPTKAKQRVVMIGDGDFLSDAYLGNGGNLLLGMNIMNWISEDEDFIAIPPKTAPDVKLELSRTDMLVMGAGFLLVLPLLLAGTGTLIWVRRRKR
jgi:ABC-type uncharacterized transport system involved in gliding motility auxiliary subunit